MTFPVVEIFGPTIQGEGPEVGTQCLFVRFGGCDYACAWCDSSHAVLPEEVRSAHRLNEAEIVANLTQLPWAPVVILSGGNPLLFNLGALVDMLHISGYRVSVETQGSKWKEWINRVDQVVVSPKPPSSGMVPSNTDLTEFLSKTRAPVAIKVPCRDQKDVQWAADLPGLFPGHPFFLSVVTLMGGLDGTYAGGRVDTVQDILDRYLDVITWAQAEPTLAEARILPQVHALAWGHERGH